jgi:hypothetical protein
MRIGSKTGEGACETSSPAGQRTSRRRLLAGVGLAAAAVLLA